MRNQIQAAQAHRRACPQRSTPRTRRMGRRTARTSGGPRRYPAHFARAARQRTISCRTISCRLPWDRVIRCRRSALYIRLGPRLPPGLRRILRILQALPPNMPFGNHGDGQRPGVQDIEGSLGRLKTFRAHSRGKACGFRTCAYRRRRADGLAGSSNSRLARQRHRVPLTVRDACRLAEWLRSRGIVAEAYYGSLDNGSEKPWKTSYCATKVKVLVATVALGMGSISPTSDL